MHYDMMLDLETFGTRPTAAILSIGAATFDRGTGEIFSRFHVRASPDLDKYTVDLGTLRWWMLQSEEARKALSMDVLPLPEVLRRFHTWFRYASHETCRVWAMPASFDLPILENAFRVEKQSTTPWRYSSPRCLRTLLDVAGINKKDRVTPKLAHDALSDCEAQIATLCLALRKLGL